MQLNLHIFVLIGGLGNKPANMLLRLGGFILFNENQTG
jgi:hypothetical protein